MSARCWPGCTTSRTGSGPQSTWPGTGSGPASTGTSPSRSPSEPVTALRAALYERLLPIARDWHARLGRRASTARRVGDPVRPPAHPRPGLPRRGMTAGIYTLLDARGRPYTSATPGALGGHRRQRIYGRLDCPAALRALARGGYAVHRVF